MRNPALFSIHILTGARQMAGLPHQLSALTKGLALVAVLAAIGAGTNISAQADEPLIGIKELGWFTFSQMTINGKLSDRCKIPETNIERSLKYVLGHTDLKLIDYVKWSKDRWERQKQNLPLQTKTGELPRLYVYVEGLEGDRACFAHIKIEVSVDAQATKLPFNDQAVSAPTIDLWSQGSYLVSSPADFTNFVTQTIEDLLKDFVNQRRADEDHWARIRDVMERVRTQNAPDRLGDTGTSTLQPRVR